ncbi:uncharacterized protein DNG_01860 [Cephalotrichum gorgonifer]|uniref:Cyanovirin-N domain-containing protein n=1 Tax=Cephalotrichum gorgonifer TaxID=2041049 RepID=A0AAE8MTG7_9PEZI|nr:uncharacterized protein DNG_01860 [Cephalotrichum gorgonifer]
MLPRPILALILLAGSAAAQGFWENCDRWSLGWDNATRYRDFMVAECSDGRRTRASFIPLNDCLANKEGQMVGERSGTVASSCASCTTKGSSMTCTCGRTFGGPVTSTVDLNKVIKSVNGVLGCHDFKGIEIDSFDSSPA